MPDSLDRAGLGGDPAQAERFGRGSVETSAGIRFNCLWTVPQIVPVGGHLRAPILPLAKGLAKTLALATRVGR